MSYAMLNKIKMVGNITDAPCHDKSYILLLGCLVEAQISENPLNIEDTGNEIMNAFEKRITANDSYVVCFDLISTFKGKTFQESIDKVKIQNCGKCRKLAF